MGIRPRLGGLIAALLMAATLQAIGPERVRRPVFDAWQRLAPRDLTYTPVRIIWIDDASIRKLGAWPWSRYLMARLTERIATGRPKVIGYDMLFSEPDRARPETFAALYPELDGATAQKVRALPSMDHVFAQVIGQSMVVLGRAGIDAPPLATSPALAVEARIPKPLPKSVQGWGQALANIPEIDDVAIGHGLLNGERDGDGVVRRVPLVGRAAALDMPGFALELARIAKGEQALAPVGGAVLSGIQLGKASLPVSPEGRMAFRFGALPKTSQVSALDILDGTIGQAALKDKIVIVGLSGAGTADLVATPLSPGVYGSVVQAEAVDAILGGGALERPGWAVWMELICAVLLVGLAVRLLPRLSPLSGAGVALGALGLLMGGSLLAFSRAGLLIDPLSPLLTAAAAATAMFALMFGESRRLVEQQRLSAARASGELAAARTIQLGMLPTRASLATLHPRVAVDALIEPARSVGGDFFEAIPIGPHHLCLLVGDVTGKGIPAALFMALSKALAKSVLLRDGADLGAAFTRLNDEIGRDNAEAMFVTLIAGLIDCRTGALAIANAGHEYPCLVRASGDVMRVETDGGPPLAVAPGFSYASETIQLAPGDTIVFVSDGITEAQNRAGGFFGSDRLEDALKRAAASAPVEDTSNALLRDVRLFEDGAEPTDDLTVLVFRYKG